MGFITNMLGIGGGNQAGQNWLAKSADISQTAKDIANAQGNIAGVQTQEQALAKRLQDIASGVGPNPAQEQYKQNVQQDVANASSILASQRGLNPALAARLAQQGAAATQQSAAAQAGVTQANQELGALSGMGGLYGQIAQQGAESGQLGLGLGNLNVSNVSQQNAAQSGVAKQNAANQGETQNKLLGGLGSAIGALVGISDGGKVKHKLVEALMRKGGEVPGKALVPGDSPKNDIVHALLSPDEIVIPRSVANAPNAPEAAAQFVANVKAKDGHKFAEGGKVENQEKVAPFLNAIRQSKEIKSVKSKHEPKGYSKVLQNKRETEEAMTHLKHLASELNRISRR